MSDLPTKVIIDTDKNSTREVLVTIKGGQVIVESQGGIIIPPEGPESLIEPYPIAHRGAPQLRPESTLEGFDLMIEMGVNALEFDVRTLSDGVLGVMHDTTVDRTTTSTGNVSNFSSTQFTSLQIEDGDYAHEVPNYNLSKTLNPILLEDITNRYGKSVWYFAESTDQLSGVRIADFMNDRGLLGNCFILSFSITDLQQVFNKYGNGVRLVYNTHNPINISQLQFAKSVGVQYICHSNTVPKSFVQTILDQGLKSFVYTIISQTERDEWIQAGCSGYVTDDAVYTSNKHTRLTNFSWENGQYVPGSNFVITGATPRFATNNTLVCTPGTNTFQSHYHLGTMSPILEPTRPYRISMDFYCDVGDPWAWFSITLATEDTFADVNGSRPSCLGYNILARRGASNKLQFYSILNNNLSSLGSDSSGSWPVADGATPNTMVVTFSSQGMEASINNNKVTVINETIPRNNLKYVGIAISNKNKHWTVLVANTKFEYLD